MNSFSNSNYKKNFANRQPRIYKGNNNNNNNNNNNINTSPLFDSNLGLDSTRFIRFRPIVAASSLTASNSSSSISSHHTTNTTILTPNNSINTNNGTSNCRKRSLTSNKNDFNVQNSSINSSNSSPNSFSTSDESESSITTFKTTNAHSNAINNNNNNNNNNINSFNNQCMELNNLNEFNKLKRTCDEFKMIHFVDSDLLEDNIKDLESTLVKLMDNEKEQQQNAARAANANYNCLSDNIDFQRFLRNKNNQNLMRTSDYVNANYIAFKSPEKYSKENTIYHSNNNSTNNNNHECTNAADLGDSVFSNSNVDDEDRFMEKNANVNNENIYPYYGSAQEDSISTPNTVTSTPDSLTGLINKNSFKSPQINNSRGGFGYCSTNNLSNYSDLSYSSPTKCFYNSNGQARRSYMSDLNGQNSAKVNHYHNMYSTPNGNSNGNHSYNQHSMLNTTNNSCNITNNSNNNNNTNNNNKKSIKMSVPSSKRQVLEEEFRKEKYPSNDKLLKLSSKLNMKYEDVQNYFKRRRREEKETNHKFSNLVKLLNNYLEQEED